MSDRTYTREDMYSPEHVTDKSLRWILEVNGTGLVSTHHVFDLVVEVMACHAEYAQLKAVKDRMGAIIGALMAQGKLPPEDVREAIRRYDERLAEVERDGD